MTASLDYALLGATSTAYATSNLLLAHGSSTTSARGRGMAGVLHHPAYLAGVLGQGVGFGLALVARRNLPLLVVQSGVTASLALTAIGGALLGRWQLTWTRVAGVSAVVAGLALAASAGRPGPAGDPGMLPLLACLSAVVVSLLALPASVLARLGIPARLWPAVQGLASGIGFGASAVGARVAVGNVLGTQVELGDVIRLLTTTTGFCAMLLLAGGLASGQVLLTAALTSNTVTGPIAAMHVVENVAPAAIGVAFLGDVVAPGGGWPAGLGVALAAAGSLLLAGQDHTRCPSP
jgi:hypothetical protein